MFRLDVTVIPFRAYYFTKNSGGQSLCLDKFKSHSFHSEMNFVQSMSVSGCELLRQIRFLQTADTIQCHDYFNSACLTDKVHDKYCSINKSNNQSVITFTNHQPLSVFGNVKTLGHKNQKE